MKNTISLKKPTFYILIIVFFATGFIGGIAVTTYRNTKNVVNLKSDNLQGMEKAILDKIKENPDNVQLLVQLGHFYFDNDKYRKAIETYEKVLRIKPDQPDIMTDLAIMYRRAGDKNQALKVLNKTIEKFPKHQPSRFNKGIILSNDFRDMKGTIKTWEELYKLNPMFKTPDGQNLGDVIKHYKENHGNKK